MLQATRVLAAYTGRGGGIIVRRGIKPTLSSSSSPSSTLSSSYISSRRLDGGINHIIGRHRLFSSSTSTAPSLDVIITNACVKRVKALQSKSGKPELKLRLAVEGGGCSGFQYTFTVEDGPLNEDDRVFEREGAKLVVDEGALELVKGATVDFVEDMMRSAFAVINNPQSESACGCGSSFAIKSFQKNPAID